MSLSQSEHEAAVREMEEHPLIRELDVERGELSAYAALWHHGLVNAPAVARYVLAERIEDGS